MSFVEEENAVLPASKNIHFREKNLNLMNSAINTKTTMDALTPQTPSAKTTAALPAKSWTRHIATGIRILLGLMFLVFGLNGFLHFIPEPTTPMPEGAVMFATALMKSGYMMPLIAGTQLLVGVLLLVNRCVPFALVVLAPFMVNSIAFHLFLERTGLPMALVIFGLQLYLAWVYRKAYRPLFTSQVP